MFGRVNLSWGFFIWRMFESSKSNLVTKGLLCQVFPTLLTFLKHLLGQVQCLVCGRIQKKDFKK